MSSPNTLTRDSFTETQWDALCRAKIAYTRGTCRGTWYQLLRSLCGYRTGSPVKDDMERLVDLWLLEHPSWVKHQERRLALSIPAKTKD
jgi:hypothetical protein